MLRSIILTFGVRICSAVLNFLVIVLLSNALGPDGKGICTRYVAIISNALIFCDLIGGPAIVFLSARYSVKSMLMPSYIWSAVTSVAVIFIFYSFGKVHSSELIHLIILSFLNSAISVHQNILSGKMEFFKVNLMIFLQALFTFVFLKILFSQGSNFPVEYMYALYVAWAPVALLGFLFVSFFSDVLPQINSVQFIKQAFRYGFANQAGHILQFFSQRLSYFLLGEKPLGIFSNATSIGESVWMVSNSIATVQYGKISNTEDKKKAERISFVLLKLNLLLCFAGALLLAILPDNFFTWIFGKEFSGIHAVLLFLFPGLVFFSGYLILGHHFSGRGQFAKNLWPIIVGLIFTLAGLGFIYFRYHEFSVTHAALLTSIAYFGNFITALILFCRDAKLTFSDFLPSSSDLIFFKEELRRKPENSNDQKD